MNRSWITRNSMITLTLLALLGLAVLTAGCGKKPPVEIDPEAGMEDVVTEEVPPAPQPEVTQPPVEATPDYGSMDPAEYGIEDIFFAFDQYELDDVAMGILSRNARILRQAGVPVLVSGHCDERGTVEYNLALGEKRANAVRDYLVSLGVSARNLRATSYGESKPFASGSNETVWAQNRRAHFERP